MDGKKEGLNVFFRDGGMRGRCRSYWCGGAVGQATRSVLLHAHFG